MRFALAILLWFPVMALTTISDNLYNADGSPVNGTLQIQWQTFQAANGHVVQNGRINYAVVNGVVNLTLEPTDTAKPSVIYTVTYVITGAPSVVERWMVPTSSIPVSLSSVRVIQPPPSGPYVPTILNATFNFTAAPNATPMPWTQNISTPPLTMNSPATVNIVCPAGVFGNPPFTTQIYITGGTGNPTPDVVTLTSTGTCVPGQSGTLVFTPHTSRSGTYTIGSASAGIGEAVNTLGAAGGSVLLQGSYTRHGTISFGPYNAFIGSSRGDSVHIGGGTMILDASDAVGPTFQYLSNVVTQSSPPPGYDINSGIAFMNLDIECTTSGNCIQINNATIPTPPQVQGNVLNPTFINVRLKGSYGTATDANRWTNVVASKTELRNFGVLLSCVQCNDLHASNVHAQYGGIGYYGNGQDNIFDGGFRFANNACHIYLDGSNIGTFAASAANSNSFHDGNFLANQRVPAVYLDTVFDTRLFSNYFETYCPSGQFVRSVNGFGLRFSNNRIDDPNNPNGCLAAGGPANTNNTTPMLHLEDTFGDILTENIVLAGIYQVPPIEIAYTYWSTQEPNPIQCIGNGQFFPCPGVQMPLYGANSPNVTAAYPSVPGVLTKAPDTYKMNVFNMPADNVGPATSFGNIWQQSTVLTQGDYIPVDTNGTATVTLHNSGVCSVGSQCFSTAMVGRLVSINGTAYTVIAVPDAGHLTLNSAFAGGTLSNVRLTTMRWVISNLTNYIFFMPLKDLGYTTFTLRFTGRKTGSSTNGAYTVTYYDGTGTQQWTSGALNANFTATTEVETKLQTVSASGGTGPGYFKINWSGAAAELEQLELVPVS